MTKLTTLFFSLFCLLQADLCFAQNTIEGCKAKIKRVRLIPKGKSGVDIFLPQITLSNSALTKKLNTFLTIDSVSGYTLKEIKQDIKEYGGNQGLTACDFEISYNKNCMLSLKFTLEYMGAYPSTVFKFFNFNLSTGELITSKDLFTEKGRVTLSQICLNTLNKKILQRKEEVKSDKSGCDSELEHYKPIDFSIEDLDNFYIDEKKIEFVYDFHWPHYRKGCEPDGSIPIPFSQLGSYVKSTGPLSFLLLK